MSSVSLLVSLVSLLVSLVSLFLVSLVSLLVSLVSLLVLASVAQLVVRLTGDQEVAGSTPAEVVNSLSWRLIVKYFLRSFSPFR